jgi:hypothetical protein
MKEHLKSAAITFVTGFAISIVPVIDSISLDSLQDGTALALIFVALRAGIKSLIEYFINRKTTVNTLDNSSEK